MLNITLLAINASEIKKYLTIFIMFIIIAPIVINTVIYLKKTFLKEEIKENIAEEFNEKVDSNSNIL